MLLAESLRDADSPHCRAVLFRRTYPELEEVWARADRLLPTILPGVKASSSTHEFRLPAGGKLFLRHLAEEDSVQIHRSSEYSFIGFDELTTFTESQYRFLFSRARSSKGLHVRIRSATNPGGIGHDWVKKRWAPWIEKDHQGYKAKAGERMYFLTHPRTGADIWVPEGTQGALSRSFIPARLSDNRALVEADPEYAARLASLDPLTRAQLAEGDWEAKSSQRGFFRREWFGMAEAPRAARRVRYWDRAATEAAQGKDPDWTVGLLLALSPQGRYVVEDMRRVQAGPGRVMDLIRQTAQDDGLGVEVALSQDPAAAGVFEANSYLNDPSLHRFVLTFHRETGSKVDRAKAVSAQVAPRPGGERGLFDVVSGEWNASFFSEVEDFPTKGIHDDVPDALGGAFRVLAQGGGCEGEHSASSHAEDSRGGEGYAWGRKAGKEGYRW
jgi:predicted phage terminase large subunit-like protein